jgi:hypothetical protein
MRSAAGWRSLTCDLRYAAEDARLSVNFASWASTPE